MQQRATLIMCGGNASEWSIFNRFSLSLPESQIKSQKIGAHANQNRETSFTVAAETTPERAADPPAQSPHASLCPRKDTGL